MERVERETHPGAARSRPRRPQARRTAPMSSYERETVLRAIANAKARELRQAMAKLGAAMGWDEVKTVRELQRILSDPAPEQRQTAREAAEVQRRFLEGRPLRKLALVGCGRSTADEYGAAHSLPEEDGAA